MAEEQKKSGGLRRPDVMLLYGDSGAGKTAQLGQIAEWEYEKTGGITRLISADSGWDPIEHLIISDENPEGCVEAWNIQYSRNPFPALVSAGEGAWPQVVVRNGGRILVMSPTPRDSEGRMLCRNGKRITQYAIEGISTIGDATLQDHIRQQRKIGQDTVGTFSDVVVEHDPAGKEVPRSITFAKAAPSHYGQVQDFILLDLVPRFGVMPVSRVFWTGHEAKGKDEITGIEGSVLGPATVGKAAVARTARKFGEYLHLTVNNSYTSRKDASGKVLSELVQDYRAWYVPHPDDVLTKMLWPAKLALPLKLMAEMHRDFPGGYIPLELGAGVTKYLEWKERIGSG